MLLTQLNLAPDRPPVAPQAIAVLLASLALATLGAVRCTQASTEIRALQAQLQTRSEPQQLAPSDTAPAPQRLAGLPLRALWSDLMAALEAAAARVDGGVSIVSLVPEAPDATALRFRVTVVALRFDLLQAYLAQLDGDARVRALTLVSQKARDMDGPGALGLVFLLDLGPARSGASPPEPARAPDTDPPR